jgi:hypothetical protein
LCHNWFWNGSIIQNSSAEVNVLFSYTQGFLKVGKKRPFSVMLLCEAQIHRHEEGRDGV